MNQLEKKLSSFSESVSSVKHEKKIVRSFSRQDIIELNNFIEPKIRQNAQERAASMRVAARCIVGGK